MEIKPLINNFLKNRNVNNVVHYNNQLLFFKANPLKPLDKDTVEFSPALETHCSVSGFEIKKIKNLYCPACGKLMLNDEQIDFFVNDIKNKKGVSLANALEKYEDETNLTHKPRPEYMEAGIYRGNVQEVVDKLKELAVENPNMNLLQLVKLQAKNSIDNLISMQMIVICKLYDYINETDMSPKTKDAFRKILHNYKKIIKGEVSEQFSRKKFIKGLETVKISPDIKKQIVEIASKMPNSENDVNSFFVKYAKKAKTSQDVARRLVAKTSIPTTEHLIPQAIGGKDVLENYICDCASCNNSRGTTSISDWVDTMPEFNQRLQSHLKQVQNAIYDGKTNDLMYRTYVERIIPVLERLSDGKIILDKDELVGKKDNTTSRYLREITEIEKQIRALMRKRDLAEKTYVGANIPSYRINFNELKKIEFRIEKLKHAYIEAKCGIKDCSDAGCASIIEKIKDYTEIRRRIREEQKNIRENALPSICSMENVAELENKIVENYILLNKAKKLQNKIDDEAQLDREETETMESFANKQQLNAMTKIGVKYANYLNEMKVLLSGRTIEQIEILIEKLKEQRNLLLDVINFDDIDDNIEKLTIKLHQANVLLDRLADYKKEKADSKEIEETEVEIERLIAEMKQLC